jgi:hypothetical protein
MTEIEIIESNKKIALFLDWFIRKPEKDNFVGVEIYNELDLRMCRHAQSQNPKFALFETTNFWDTKYQKTVYLERKMIVYIDVKHLNFEKSWDWFMLAWSKVNSTVQGFDNEKSEIMFFIKNVELLNAYHSLVKLVDAAS